MLYPPTMMLKVLPVTALILALSGGAALADRRGGDRGGDRRGVVVVRDHGESRGGRVVRDHRDWRRDGWNARPRYERGVRRPIYVSRPVIRDRYYDYRYRPQLIVENYNTMPGYTWVAGRWSWNGYEWAWQPGHYEPDQHYADPDCDHDHDRY
jgi:hypothetical protein